jgi:signal transduction histidine kinase
MISVDRAQAGFIAAVLALWLAAAVWATLLGWHRMRAARRAHAEAERLSALIALAPAVPLLIDKAGVIEADTRLGDWLGLDNPPRQLADLIRAEDGLRREDVEALAADIATASRSARKFSRSVTMSGSGRVLLVRGKPFSRAGDVILWFIDMTDSEREIARLAGETMRLTQRMNALSALIEAAPFPMWHRDHDMRLALVNGAYVRAVEADSAATVVQRGLELLEAGSQPLAIPAPGGNIADVSIRIAPAIIGGQRRMIRVVDVPLGAAGLAGYAIDVQELEEARADLRHFAEAQRDLLDRISAGVAQFASDQSLTFHNRHFQRLFAMDAEWLAERPEMDRVLERMRDTRHAPERRDFPSWKAERRAWFNATGAVEENWLLPNGTHLRVVAQPLPDGGLLLIFEDRTEHLQLATARDTLLRVRTATFDNLFEAVGVFAGDGRLHLWNSRFRDVWNLTEEDLARHPRVDSLVQAIAPKLVDPARAGVIRDVVRIATLERHQRSGRMVLTDGRHFEFAAVPLPDGNALFTLLDITASRGIEEALRDRNEALEEADKLKTAFVANMSYELRTPLTSIAGFAEMLAGGYAGELPPVAREYVDAINSAAMRLSSLIGDALDLTQSEAGNLPMSTERVDLGELVREAASVAADAARLRGQTLVLDADAKGPFVTGDPRRLRQSLDHLLRNATVYTQGGGRILLRAKKAGECAEIVVSDNGPGIAMEQQERIFHRFRRGTMDIPSDGGQPLGVGLPLTRQFVEAHGGSLELTSEEGEGTSIIIRLPLAEASILPEQAA